jgi:hypothetical protein
MGNARKRQHYGQGRAPSQPEQVLLAHGNDSDAPGMKEAAAGGLSPCVTVWRNWTFTCRRVRR